MKLYGSPVSAFVQRVLLAARFKGHELAVELPPGGSARSPEFAALSPMRRVPVLIDGDLSICESSAIVAHLDEVLPGPALLPGDAAGRARARAIAQIAEAEFGAGLRPFIIQAAPAVQAAGAAQAALGLDALERLIDAAGPWAAGAQPGIGDAALVPMILLSEMLETTPGVAPFIGARPRLRAYRERALAHPHGARVAAEMAGLRTALLARPAQQAQQQQQ